MQEENQLVKDIYEAKKDIRIADTLIEKYIPYIKKEVSKYTNHYIDNHDDEFSIGMIAFHEAILSYLKDKGNFLSYASMIIRSRLIDYDRKELRHQNQLSLDIQDEDDNAWIDNIEDKRNETISNMNVLATKEEISELALKLKEFDIDFTDIANNSPKQERTLKTIKKVIIYAKENTFILEEVLKTKKLPIKTLVKNTGVDKKTIERHRKYLMGMLIILTNGYDIIRGHLWNVYQKEGNL